jgi:hypothetical protein
MVPTPNDEHYLGLTALREALRSPIHIKAYDRF